MDRIFDDAGLDITDMEFESFMEQCKNRESVKLKMKNIKDKAK